MADPFDTTPEPESSPDIPPSRRANPRVPRPNEDPRLHPLRDPLCSLAEELGPTADELRQIATDFGLRPYRLFSVVVRWSGGAKGRGESRVISETEFLPTPKLSPRSIRGEARTGGIEEVGNISVTEISPRYTEEDIRVLFVVQPPPDGDEAFLEVRLDSRTGDQNRRRRFVIQGVPSLDAENFQWTARLRAQGATRNPDGSVKNVGWRQ